MNSSEYNALQQAITNEARVLYLLGLRPEADKTSGQTQPLNYKRLLNLLNSASKQFTLGRQINGLLKELVDTGLVDVHEQQDLNKSFNGKSLVLPLMVIKQDDYPALHLQYSAMHKEWQPHSELFNDLARLVGIIDAEFSNTELGEFIAYWMGRPQMQFSQFQWTQKFVFQMKQRRQASGSVNKTKVGSQWVTPKAAIEADENAKKLVEKYSKKSS